MAAEEQPSIPTAEMIFPGADVVVAEAFDLQDGATADEVFTLVPALASFCCPITGRVVTNPVVAADGIVYDREALEGWEQQAAGVETRAIEAGAEETNGAAEQVPPGNPDDPDDTGTTKSPMTGKPMPNATYEAEKMKSSISTIQGLLGGADDDAPDSVEFEKGQGKTKVVPIGPIREFCRNHGARSTSMSLAIELSKPFVLLDPVRDLLADVLKDCEPPKIVIVGQQNSGKSSLLEMLCGFPLFPRDKKFSTKLSVHVRLRRLTTDAPPSVTLSVRDINDIETKLDGHTEKIPFLGGDRRVQEKMAELLSEFAGEVRAEGLLRTKVIVLEVVHGMLPNIDLVDMPGLVNQSIKADEVRAILMEQVKWDRQHGDHAMYLMTVGANAIDGFESDQAVEFINSNDLSNKTFGVFTKCDRLEPGIEDVLSHHITGSDVKDGSTVGRANMGKGWTVSMLKPLNREKEAHPMERIYALKKAEKEFFDDHEEEIIRQLNDGGFCGTSALVERLQAQYSSYLNREWKEAALDKVLDRIKTAELEVLMLGNFEEGEKEEVAKQEVDRRLGSALDQVASSYDNDVVVVFATQLDEYLEKTRSAQLSCQEIKTTIETMRATLCEMIETTATATLDFYLGHVNELLTATCAMEPSSNECVVKPQKTSSAWFGNVLSAIKPLFMGNTKSELHLQAKNTKFVQLSQFEGFTDGIMSKLRDYLKEKLGSMKEAYTRLVDEFLKPWSKWLSWTCSGNVWTPEILPTFVMAAKLVIYQNMPLVAEIRTLHADVPVGMEMREFVSKRNELRHELQKVLRAKQGLVDAFNITPEELDGYEQAQARRQASEKGQKERLLELVSSDEKFENWSHDVPLKQWKGITVDADGQVTKVDLYSGISDDSRQKITGDLASLAGLVNLTELNLCNCYKLTGDLASLAGLDKITRLNLQRCSKITGDLKSLAGLDKITILGLGKCSNITGDLASLAGLDKITILHLKDCSNITGDLASLLAGLDKITILGLGNCSNITGDLASLAGLDKITHLNLYNCDQITGDLASLAGLVNLTGLYLWKCSKITGDKAALKKALPKLETFTHTGGTKAEEAEGL